MTSKAELIIEILNDRISDAETILRDTEIGHPMEDLRSCHLITLQDFKKDLIRSGIIVRES